jgi:hypothetical protein
MTEPMRNLKRRGSDETDGMVGALALFVWMALCSLAVVRRDHRFVPVASLEI